jgi:tetratricopeptide (TPR) repeat protein
VRLSRAAAWNAEGSAGLWRDPELELGLAWRRENRPTAAWAARYDPAFERAMAFLDRSRLERDALLEQRERERRNKLRQARWAAGILATLLVVVGALGWMAAGERNRAERNLHTANEVVDSLLLAAGSDAERDAAEIPEIEAFRKRLLDQAQGYLTGFTNQKPHSRKFREEMAQAHRRLGDIDRLLQRNRDAAAEYKTAIAQFAALRHDDPANPGYREMEAGAYNWLGETERVLATGHTEAEKAYGSAIGLEENLCRNYPAEADYQRNLARAHDNRGILRAAAADPVRAEADYREAIRLLDPLADGQSRRALAHTYNNLAILLESQNHPDGAEAYYQQAIGIQQTLHGSEPENRDYTFELAMFYNNLAMLLEGRREYPLSLQYNSRATLLFEDLARPALVFTVELAQAHTLRGRTLQVQGAPADAEKEYRQAIALFARLAPSDTARERADFHARYGEALFQLGALLQQQKDPHGARGWLTQAVEQHAAAGAGAALSFDYYWLAEANLALDAADQAQKALDRLAATLSTLPEPELGRLSGAAQQLQKRLNHRKRNERRTH